MSGGGVFGDDEDGILGRQVALKEAPLLHQEERRNYVTCDAPDCGASQLIVNGRAVDQPGNAALGTPASWASEVWFRVKGKDYCPKHHSDLAEDALASLSAELSAAERAAGFGERPLLGPAGYAFLEEATRVLKARTAGPILVGDPAPPPLPPRPSMLSSSPSLGTLGVIVLLLMAIAYLWSRMDGDECQLALDNKSNFEDRGSIQFLESKRVGNAFQCSGEIVRPDQPRVPVRYFCDREQCRFEK